MKKLIFVLLTVCAVACSGSKHGAGKAGAATGDGMSYDTPVVIREKSEGAGVDAEYKWVREHYPGSRVKKQALTQHNGKSFDVLSVRTEDGKDIDLYFDISNFFGKF